MPQMSPLLWMILFFSFTLTFLFFNILNYFNFLKFKKNNNQPFFMIDNKNNFLNWKW